MSFSPKFYTKCLRFFMYKKNNNSINRCLLATLLLGIVICISACSWWGKRDGLKIISKNFDTEINPAENLVFEFSHTLAPDSLLNKWDSTDYIVFTPHIKGQYKWVSPTKLIFSPFTPFLPNTDFSAQLTNKILSHHTNPTPLKIAEPTLNFHTPYLQINSGQAFWRLSASDASKIVLGTNLTFNYEVDAKNVVANTELKLNDQSVTFDVANTAPAREVALEINNITNLEQTADIQVNIKNNLQIGNNTKNEKPIITTIKVPSPKDLQITGVQTNHSGAEGSVSVFTSQQVKHETIKNAVQITPNIPFNIETLANGFVITSSDFDPTKNYTLTVSEQLQGVFKGKMDNGKYTAELSFGKLRPSIDFVHKSGIYLGKAGAKNLAVNIVEVPKVKVIISKIFENNILSLFRAGTNYGYEEQYDSQSDFYDYYDFQYYDIEHYGKTIAEYEVETAKLPASSSGAGILKLLNIDIQDKIKSYNGIYVIQITDSERRFITDSKVIAFSDIGLIAKREKNKVWVFANSIKTAEPLQNVDINFISKNNQIVSTQKTNSEGIAVFDNEKSEEVVRDFKIEMVTAEKQEDFTYLLFEQTNVNTARFEVGGKTANKANLDAFLYAERDLYRPAESIHLNAIVRNNSWETPANQPVIFKLFLPNGKEYRTLRKTLNAQGAAEATFDMPANIVTGTYNTELYTADEVLLASKTISVEEFLPDRIKVDARLNADKIALGENVLVTGKATNLFGPPAANRNTEFQMTLKRKTFNPKAFEQYTFEVNGSQSFEIETAESKTNANGEFNHEFVIKPEYKNMGILEGKVFITVFDESGRPVNRIKPFTVFTQNVMYGIGNFGSYADTRKGIDIPLIALDPLSEKPLTATAEVTIVRTEWRTVMESTGSKGGYRYRSQKDEITELQKTINISGASTKIGFIPTRSGEYEVRIKLPNTTQYVAYQFYAYGSGDTQSTSFEVNREGKIDIETDKDTYKVGETAKILFKTPFEGKLLVTVEQNQVLTHHYFATDKKARSFTLPLTDAHIPNVYITATLIRPFDAQTADIPLSVAHGFVPIMVQNPNNDLSVKINAPTKTNSQTKQTIRIETEPNTELTLAVVDEGILQIKDYKSPDPKAFFYQKRELGVLSADLYPYLFPELITAGKLTGGDGSYNLSKRVNPVMNKRVQLVSYWTGIVKSNNNGVFEKEIDIPEFAGELRIMAVAYKNKKMGSATATLQVADPVVISAGLPRFASPFDTLKVPITLTNTTNQAATATVNITATNGFEIKNTALPLTLQLPANAETQQFITLVAPSQIGTSQIKISAQAFSKTFNSTTELSVRPPASLQKVHTAGEIVAGKTQTIDLPPNASQFLPQSIDGIFTLSRSPLGAFATQISELIQYPHGCVEQTISAAIPQLYAANLATALHQKIPTATLQNSNNPTYNVQEAIKKIESMQLANGGLSYWQGTNEESWWGSVYAAHFLLEAQKNGFEINTTIQNKLFSYIQNKIRNKETYNYDYFDDNGKKQTRKIAPKEVIYSLYVLALAGKPSVSTMNYYKANPSLLSIDCQYLLASTYTLAGDRTKAQQILPKQFANENSLTETAGSFSSPMRDKALALIALFSAQPQNPQIATLTQQLIADYNTDRWHSTQETAFLVMALGKINNANLNNTAEATITANAKNIAQLIDKDITINQKVINATTLNLATKGNGKLFYSWNTEGLTNNGAYTEEDSYMQVRRTFFDRYGKAIKGTTFEQNDLVIVQIALTSKGANTVKNVVITDMLPAGFEIENPRITEAPEMNWIKNATEPTHRDIRDDRINLFTDATAKTQYFYYAVRAVTAGNFKLGPVAADAMYNGEYHSYHGGGMVNVKTKK